MSLSKKGELNYRCPACFGRDIDMDMFYDEEKKEYYCLRCGFVGNIDEVKAFNEQDKRRYKYLKYRVVSFNEDDEPITFKPHVRGEQ